MKQLDRRDFLKFLGATTLTASQISLLSSMTSCNSDTNTTMPINSIKPSFEDKLILAPNFNYKIVVSWGDQINEKETFGFNNDYIAIESLSSDKALLWVNHEYALPVFVSGSERTKENIDKELQSVGGSIIEINKVDDNWIFNSKSSYNKGIRGHTKIPFSNKTKIMGQDYAIGTNSNCAGGKTPWGTFLSCEENYYKSYGERDFKTGKRKPSTIGRWETIYDYPPEHYGWVLEIDPKTGNAVKHTSIGRFAHECATCIQTNERTVVYSGDDKKDEHVYKFVSDTNDSIDSGKLYVADIENGKWLSLNIEDSPILKSKFKNQLEIQTYTREAAKLVGATPLARPEDIEIHPITKDVFVSLSNNKDRENYYGSILKISEKNKDHTSLEFKAETYVLGGKDSGIACPDNLAFDQNGNLWICNDISGKDIGNAPYKAFGNNALFVIPIAGKDMGKVIQIASAPKEAEFTGLCFSEDQKTLFLSVQHPGELTSDSKNPTSTWPTGKDPKPSVIAITGKALEEYTKKSS